MCISVCMQRNVHVCMHVYIHIHKYSTYIYTYSYIYMNISVYFHMFCMFAEELACMRACMYVGMQVSVHTCSSLFTYVGLFSPM